MILPDLILPSRVNQTWSYSGMDSIERCRDKKHFKSYPYDITYNYNSRGFRDAEWPSTMEELQSAIWCIGDSFTVGVGSSLEHTWPQILQQVAQRRTINVSMDGASNNWIARKSLRILEEIGPDYLIIHWSYSSRREAEMSDVARVYWSKFYNNIKDPMWPDCDWENRILLPAAIQQEINLLHGGITVPDDERRIHLSECSDQEDIDNTLECIARVDSCASSCQIVHSFIPGFVPPKFKGIFESQLTNLAVPELTKLDLARDGHHYDVKTSHYFCQQLVDLLNL